MSFALFNLMILLLGIQPVHAVPESLSIQLEIEQAGVTHPKKDLTIHPSSDWNTLKNDSNLVVLTRTPNATAGGHFSLELLILDSTQPGKIIAQPTIQLRETEQTRARLKLDNGDWVSVRVKRELN